MLAQTSRKLKTLKNSFFLSFLQHCANFLESRTWKDNIHIARVITETGMVTLIINPLRTRVVATPNVLHSSIMFQKIRRTSSLLQGYKLKQVEITPPHQVFVFQDFLGLILNALVSSLMLHQIICRTSQDIINFPVQQELSGIIYFMHAKNQPCGTGFRTLFYILQKMKYSTTSNMHMKHMFQTM